MENRRLLISGWWGGLVTAVLSSIPYLNFINCFCCIGIMLGGMTALLYHDHGQGSMNYIGAAQAVTIGITAGLMAAFLSLVISWMVYLSYGHWEIRLLQSMAEHLEEVPEYLENELANLENQASRGFSWNSLLVSNLIVFPIFCLCGSLLTRLFLNKNRLRL
jgi:hypothetical protein